MQPILRTYFPLSPESGRTLSRLDSWFDRVFGEDGDGLSRGDGERADLAVSVWGDENHLPRRGRVAGRV